MAGALRNRLLGRARFAREIREFFSQKGYVEVDTPALSPFLFPEPAIEVFKTELLSRDSIAGELYLAPSPEIWMKRLLARGSGNIFQISRCFRNSESEASPVHNPEFRLLECYTVGAGYRGSIDLIEELFLHLLATTEVRLSHELISPPFLRLTMEEAFRNLAGIELARCQEVQSLVDAGRGAGLRFPENPTWEEAFHIAFLTLVEPFLPRERPLVLLDYPALIPTTARSLEGTPWAERWELYARGVEIANCYTEQTDQRSLSSLLASERERKRACRVPHAIDEEFAGIFPDGFPDCAGVALGVDRLEMIFLNEGSLEGVINYPVSTMMRRSARE